MPVDSAECTMSTIKFDSVKILFVHKTTVDNYYSKTDRFVCVFKYHMHCSCWVFHYQNVNYLFQSSDELLPSIFFLLTQLCKCTLRFHPLFELYEQCGQLCMRADDSLLLLPSPPPRALLPLLCRSVICVSTLLLKAELMQQSGQIYRPSLYSMPSPALAAAAAKGVTGATVRGHTTPPGPDCTTYRQEQQKQLSSLLLKEVYSRTLYTADNGNVVLILQSLKISHKT